MSTSTVKIYKPRRGATGIFRRLADTAIASVPIDVRFSMQRLTGRRVDPDYAFPRLIELEISSQCNLHCIHCPSHEPGRDKDHRVFSHMDVALFNRIMDETDRHGKRSVALHKDGEPLLNPSVRAILHRVKRFTPHDVYLSTNAHPLTPDISRAILDSRINTVNFNIGAISDHIYRKIRGGSFDRVVNNIDTFMELASRHQWKPRVIAQIIDLPEIAGMDDEIRAFKRFWTRRGLEVQVWGKLNWGVYARCASPRRRFPCLSLWESVSINSDGLVSACCMDWRRHLLIGDANVQSIEEIWRGDELKMLRTAHIDHRENGLSACATCNYWAWQPKLKRYLT